MMRSCSKPDVCKQRLRIKYMPEANFFNADIDENRYRGNLGLHEVS